MINNYKLFRPTQRYLLYQWKDKKAYTLIPVDLYNRTTSFDSIGKAKQHTIFMVKSLKPNAQWQPAGCLKAPKLHYDDTQIVRPFETLNLQQLQNLPESYIYQFSSYKIPDLLPKELINLMGMTMDWVLFDKLNIYHTDLPTEYLKLLTETIPSLPINEISGDFSYNFAIQYYLKLENISKFIQNHPKKRNTIQKFIKRNYDGVTFKTHRKTYNKKVNSIPNRFLKSDSLASIDYIKSQLESFLEEQQEEI